MRALSNLPLRSVCGKRPLPV